MTFFEIWVASILHPWHTVCIAHVGKIINASGDFCCLTRWPTLPHYKMIIVWKLNSPVKKWGWSDAKLYQCAPWCSVICLFSSFSFRFAWTAVHLIKFNFGDFKIPIFAIFEFFGIFEMYSRFGRFHPIWPFQIFWKRQDVISLGLSNQNKWRTCH